MTRSRCPNTPAPDVGDDAAGNHAAGHVTGYFMKRMLPAAVAALSLATLSLAPLPFAEAPAVAQAAPSDAAMRATVDRLIARMTIEEKAGQLSILGDDYGTVDDLARRGLRSEERRVGKGSVRTCRSRGSPYN